MKKNETRQVRCGDVLIGGGAPVSIQSMTNVDSRDERALTEQIARLADAGCQIVRTGRGSRGGLWQREAKISTSAAGRGHSL